METLFFQDLVENSPDLIQIISPEGRLLYVNRSWRETLGYESQDLASLNFFDLLCPDPLGYHRSIFHHALQGKKVRNSRVMLITKQGDNLELHGYAIPQWQDGKIVAAQSVLRPLTAQTEEGQRQVEQWLSQAVEPAPISIALVTLDGRILRANRALCRFFRYRQDRLEGRSAMEITHQDDLALEQSLFQRALAGDLIVDMKIGVRLEYARLLSERTTMLHRLQAQQQVLLDLLNQLDIGILLLDGAGRIRFSNDTYGRMVGLNPNELVGRDWAEMALFCHKAQEQIQHLLSAPPTQRSRLSLNWETPDGRCLWAECEVRDNPSDPRERLLLFYDVSELYQRRSSLSNDHDPRMIGTSQPMLRLYQLIEDTARGDWTVLIEGETGTGKELVARSIHTASPRHQGPFIAVNSAGLSESLLSSQLFGHRRGAFTGALANQEGVFEAANGGTLFLDEIGDLPLSMQASLLRVLDQREIVRVGESRPRKVDVRIIAATHKALTTEVREGRFREDLLFRLRVARIAVPPLRQRQSDIPLLVQAFLHESSQVAGKIITQVSSKAMQYLLDYPWPGNVRELKSCIDYAVIQSRGPVLQPDQLPPEIGRYAPTSIPPAKGDDDERSRLLQALEQARGNRTRAARLLGISRATFYRRLIDLGISAAK